MGGILLSSHIIQISMNNERPCVEHDFVALLGFLTHTPVVCAYCGQVREVRADGTVIILRQRGEVKNGSTEETTEDSRA